MIVTGAFVLLSVFLFPIAVQFKGYMVLTEKILYFSVKLYSLIRIMSGSVAWIDSKLLFCHGKRQKWIELSDLKKGDARFEITNGFQVLSYSQIYEHGSEKDETLLFLVYHIVSNLVMRFFKVNKNFLQVNNDLLVNETTQGNNLLQEVVTITNGLVLLIALSKILIGKVKNYGRQKQEIG